MGHRTAAGTDPDHSPTTAAASPARAQDALVERADCALARLLDELEREAQAPAGSVVQDKGRDAARRLLIEACTGLRRSGMAPRLVSREHAKPAPRPVPAAAGRVELPPLAGG